MDDMPEVRQTGFCNKFKALLIGNWQSMTQNGLPFILTGIVLLVFVIFACCYLPLKFQTWGLVDYSNLGSNFGDDSLNIRYNKNYADGSANSLVQNILSSQNNLNGIEDNSWVIPTTTPTNTT